MSKLRISINSKTLFPIERMKENLREAFTIAKELGSAVITKANRPAYAIIRIDDVPDNDYTVSGELSRALSDRLEQIRSSSMGCISTDQSQRL